MNLFAEAFVRRVWTGGGGAGAAMVRLLLVPLELLFISASAVRNHLYDRGWRRVSVGALPTISIGNLSVGGTGKTPLTRWIAERLLEENVRPGIVASGYGSDEPLLHRRWNPELPVVADRDRARGIARIAAEGAGVALLDDAFQHRRVDRAMDIVLLAAEDPFPLRRLPRGPFREGAAALARADALLLTRRTATDSEVARWVAWLERHAPDTPLHRVTLGISGWAELDGTPAPPPIRGESCFLTASIAAPERFRIALEALLGPQEGFFWPDHHEYDRADIRRLRALASGRSILTTEKDAVKLFRFREELPGVRVAIFGVESFEEEGRMRAALRRAGTNRSPGADE